MGLCYSRECIHHTTRIHGIVVSVVSIHAISLIIVWPGSLVVVGSATAHHGISIHLCSTSTRRFKITSGAAGGSATIAGSGGWEWHRLRAWPGWEWLRPWGWWGRGSETAFRLATVV